MKKLILKLLSCCLVLSIIVAGCLFYAIYISPDHITLNLLSVSSTEIPESMDNVSIGYFSDVLYLGFMDEERLDAMLSEIEAADADIILFGGDLFEDATSEAITADVISSLTKKLSALEAPLGKFYVLGDRDLVSEDTKTLVSDILENAGFEDLTNKNIRIHNGENESITLVGLDNSINGEPVIEDALANTSSDSYTIVFTHTPDNTSLIGEGSVDLFIAGHSLGGQIYFPILGTLSIIEGASTYLHGEYEVNDMLVVVSNGLGTIDIDMRLFAPPQYTIIRLKHEEEEIEEEEEDTSSEAENEDSEEESSETSEEESSEN